MDFCDVAPGRHGCSLVMPLASIEALATTMYSYIDEQGTPGYHRQFQHDS